ncbi:MAG: oxidoreductase, partial [Rhodopirellula bahusiensis]
MSELHFPWIECSILVPLLGAVWLQLRSNSERALRDTVVVCVVTLLLTIGELVDFTWVGAFEAHDHWP